MTDLTRERLAELRAVAEHVTHGPWLVWPRHHPQQDYTVGPDDATLPVCRTFGSSLGTQQDAHYIATFDPLTVLTLIAQCEAGLPASGGALHLDADEIAQLERDKDSPPEPTEYMRDVAKRHAALAASGGVSGEDGGLIARTREIIADAPLGFHEDAPELQLIRNAETLCARLSALLAERDGLKQKIDALEAEVATESYSRGKDEEELSTSSAALAKALGLLREFPASGYQGAPGVRALIKAFLAKHGHQNWDGAWS